MDESANEDKVIRVDMRGQRPLNNPNCIHDHFIDEQDADSNDQQVVVKCHNCPLGFIALR